MQTVAPVRIRFRDSVAMQFILLLLGFSALATAITSTLTIRALYQDQLQQLEMRLTELEQSRLPALSNSLWVLDDEQLNLQLSGIMQLPDLVYAAVIGDGERVVDQGDAELSVLSASNGRHQLRVYPLRFVFRAREQQLGELRLVVDMDAIRERVRVQGMRIVLERMVVMLLEAIVVFFLFYVLVGRNLRAITEYFRTQGPLEARVPLKLDRGVAYSSGRDEFQVLSDSINAMLGDLRAQYDTIREAEREHANLIAILEDKNAELERFTYTASHDLKSPLVTISGFLGYLRKDIERQDQARMAKDLDRIQEAVESMQSLLEGLLKVSRARHGTEALVPVNLDQVLDRALAMLEAQLAAQQGKVLRHDALPTILGDRVQLQEVFVNLIENALKYRSAAAPVIEIGVGSVMQAEPAGSADSVTLYVRDNGIGIPPAYLTRVFGLFERVASEIPGTGVGLAIVKRIVELHGGRIWAESAGNGSGTTFHLQLPLMPPGAT